MQASTHLRLAQHCLQSLSHSGPIRQLAFLFGSIEPDINLLSYFKGANHGTGLHGHNYTQALLRIDRLSQQLHTKTHWGIQEYYRLGKLTHYAADAFTFPHNRRFHGSMRAHIRYEADLDACFQDRLQREKTSMPPYLPMQKADFPSLLRWRHQLYEQTEMGLKKDTIYILEIVQAAMDIFVPVDTPAYLPKDIHRLGGALR